ncbi:MAG: hypothetical protein A3D44_03680 [Candidatus Staskawiczbacteria bacterium RIFCSPHIGHO2_02_FULL_42_22]|uniref:DUF3899 domain-containing protein n=1 Tax=Candidatus Staskawiczbacteria bacterium RIFCSPHIGHO2_02_FULL_42_22 TaxID=1802207 RepID=A0A1G2I493_9BACT|nr:MAG: hypothetical protein A3D44_03680 [Candidatus Staskawiczbacteria bacterium RIFCSPHIGHO2_02_FULL_42_22]
MSELRKWIVTIGIALGAILIYVLFCTTMMLALSFHKGHWIMAALMVAIAVLIGYQGYRYAIMTYGAWRAEKSPDYEPWIFYASFIFEKWSWRKCLMRAVLYSAVSVVIIGLAAALVIFM